MTWLNANVLIVCLGAGISTAGLVGTLRSRSRAFSMLSLLLVVAGPVVALLITLCSTSPEMLDARESQPDLSLNEASDVQAVTDQGRPVKLYRANRPQHDGDFAAKQWRLLEQCGLADHVELVSSDWRNCNCHGWVFAGGLFFIEEPEMHLILRDNAYVQVSSPQPTDVAVYRDENNRIVHSGIVRSTHLGQIVIESQWGWGGVFLHAPEVTPYSPASCSFYRAERVGHLLRGLHALRAQAER
jgi:hypothetical protein